MQILPFADDTNIYYEAGSPEKLVLVMKRLGSYTWRVVNRLSLNIDKINFHPYNKPMKHTITLKCCKKAIPEK